MSKYINADEYRKILNDESDERTYCINENAYDDGLDRGLGIAIDILDELPPADVVEVVRCEECKHHEKSFYGNRRDYCEKRSTLEHTEYVNPTDFCSKGKRRETE